MKSCYSRTLLMVSPLHQKLNHLSKHCKSMPHLKQLLALILHSGAAAHAPALAALISFAAVSPLGDLHFAYQAFSQTPCRHTAFAYTSLIHGLVNARRPADALLLYLHMTRHGSPPDRFTFPFALKACVLLPAAGAGRALHGRILQVGLARDPHIASGLVRMYSDFHDSAAARFIFDSIIIERDITLWNSMVGGYVKCRRLEDARRLFDEMPLKNTATYNAMLKGYTELSYLESALELFEEMPERDVVSWNTMIGALARSGSAPSARELFCRAPQRNVATWSTLVSGFAQSGRFGDALEVFKEMVTEGVRPNQAVLVSVLSACAHLGALEQGVWIHGYIGRQVFEVDDLLGSALIDMYSKCGMLQGAKLVFDRLEKRHACSWTSIIYGLAIHGHSRQALHAFGEMERAGIRPNDITFIAVLRACSHAGLVQEGREAFDRMRRVYDMKPKIEHYTCMVDLLSRANLIEDAREVIESMPMKPDIFIWGALLSGLRIHGRNELMHEEDICGEIARLAPKDSGAYVLLSNIYASGDRWDDATKMRKTMEGFGVRKNPGCSLIEVEGVVHEFLASGKQHTKSEEVYEILDLIYRRIKLNHLT